MRGLISLIMLGTSLIIMLVIIVSLIVSIVEYINDEYECIDIDGNEVICTNVIEGRYGVWGTNAEGYRVELKAYKRKQ